MLSYSRCCPQTVVVGDGLDASGFGSRHKTILVTEIDSNYRHFTSNLTSTQY